MTDNRLFADHFVEIIDSIINKTSDKSILSVESAKSINENEIFEESSDESTRSFNEVDTFKDAFDDKINKFADQATVKKTSEQTSVITFFFMKVFSIINELLYLIDDFARSNLRLCVFSKLTTKIIELIYSVFHAEIRKTFQFIAKCYYFSQMLKKIMNHINECEKCQLLKSSTKKTAEKLQFVKSFSLFNHIIFIDFITELSESHDGFNALMTIIDKFSKVIVFIVCRDTITVTDVARIYIKQVYFLFKLLFKIISNRDS
jgi:Integrase zinc binding domain